MAEHVRIGLDPTSEIEGTPALEGALKALREDNNIEIIMPGDKNKISEFAKFNLLDRLYAEHTNRKGKGTPLRILTDKVNNNELDAIVTANNTRLVMASAKTKIGMYTQEFEHPAIIVPIPWVKYEGNNVHVDGFSHLLDAGANTEYTPQNLVDLAIMARLYLKHVLGVSNPTISLVNIGEESNKGRQLEQIAYKLLNNYFNPNENEQEKIIDITTNLESLEKTESLKKVIKVFQGNAEPERIFGGYSDIYVTDGFTGNIILKMGEAMVKKMFQHVKKGIYQESNFFKRNTRKLGGHLLRDLFYELKAKFDPASYGGGPMLGLNHCVIKCHGKSNEKAFYNAIKNATKYVRAKIVEKSKQEFALVRTV